MHRIFSTCHGIELLFAEYLDEIVSSVLLIAFGDTVYCKYAAWSGKHGDCRPNEGIHWAAIRWAKSQGYHYYDFEGIDENMARIKLRGEKVPKSEECPISRFKLGFRGTIQICPCAYDQVYKPMLSFAYRRILPGMKNSTFFMKIVDHVRVTASNLFLPKKITL